MLWTMILICVGCSVSQAQSPGVRPEWSGLAKESTTVVVGIVEGQKLVVHPSKMSSSAKQLPNGNVLVELPKPAEYLIGRVIRMHVVEIVKADVNRKVDSIISIFIPGAAPTESSPLFEDNQKYLVFLSPLRHSSEAFDDAMIYDPDAPATPKAPFSPASYYTVVWGNSGLLRVTPQNTNKVDEIKRNLRNSRR